MLNAKNLALSGAIIWSVFSFLFVIFVLITGAGENFINFMLSSFINGYSLNWTGAFVVLIAAFIDGFIFFYLLALIYNIFNKPEKKSESLYSND